MITGISACAIIINCMFDNVLSWSIIIKSKAMIPDCLGLPQDSTCTATGIIYSRDRVLAAATITIKLGPYKLMSWEIKIC